MFTNIIPPPPPPKIPNHSIRVCGSFMAGTSISFWAGYFFRHGWSPNMRCTCHTERLESEIFINRQVGIFGRCLSRPPKRCASSIVLARFETAVRPHVEPASFPGPPVHRARPSFRGFTRGIVLTNTTHDDNGIKARVKCAVFICMGVVGSTHHTLIHA